MTKQCPKTGLGLFGQEQVAAERMSIAQRAEPSHRNAVPALPSEDERRDADHVAVPPQHDHVEPLLRGSECLPPRAVPAVIHEERRPGLPCGEATPGITQRAQPVRVIHDLDIDVVRAGPHGTTSPDKSPTRSAWIDPRSRLRYRAVN